MPYACASVSNCLMLTIFTCTDLLGALLRAAGSNVGVRHGDVWVFGEVRFLRVGEMKMFANCWSVDESVKGSIV